MSVSVNSLLRFSATPKLASWKRITLKLKRSCSSRRSSASFLPGIAFQRRPGDHRRAAERAGLGAAEAREVAEAADLGAGRHVPGVRVLVPQLPCARLLLAFDVLLVVDQVPGRVGELVEADDRAVVGHDRLAVALDQQAGHRLEALARVDGLDHVAEGDLALAEAHGVGDSLLEEELGGHAGEPAAPDDRAGRGSAGGSRARRAPRGRPGSRGCRTTRRRARRRRAPSGAPCNRRAPSRRRSPPRSRPRPATPRSAGARAGAGLQPRARPAPGRPGAGGTRRRVSCAESFGCGKQGHRRTRAALRTVLSPYIGRSGRGGRLVPSEPSPDLRLTQL